MVVFRIGRSLAPLAFAVALAGCGGPMLVMSGGQYGDFPVEIQVAAHGTTQLVSFVKRFDPDRDEFDDVASTSAILVDGDWLISLEANTSSIVRLSPGGATRWKRRGRLLAAVAATRDLVVGFGYLLADDAPPSDPHEERAPKPGIVALDPATGRTRWTLPPAVVAFAEHARVVRVADTTIIVTTRGSVAVDDRGVIRWQLAESGSHPDVEVAVTGRAIALVSSGVTLSTTDLVTEPTHKDPCSVRLIDAGTGAVVQSTELVPDGTRCTVAGVAVSPDALAIHIVDDDFRRPNTIPAVRLFVLDPATLATRGSVSDPMTRSAMPSFDGRLGPHEAAFLDQYATRGALALTIVDTVSYRVRHAEVVVPGRVTVGPKHGFDSYAQVTTTNELDRILFVGTFVGNLRVGGELVRSEIREIDACAAQHHVECFGTDGKTTTTVQTAGIVGMVGLRR